MSMDHKAYVFDWRSFEKDELSILLKEALATNRRDGLVGYINKNLEHLKDPYEGDPLDDEWEDLLENRDVHEYGDFALTRFYDPADSGGLCESWISIDDSLSDEERSALLGTSFGDPGNEFDPGRQGSYFQTPEQVKLSLATVAGLDTGDLEDEEQESLEEYRALLEESAKRDMGLYVTF